MVKVKRVTAWEAIEHGEPVHNHIEEGWVIGTKPAPNGNPNWDGRYWNKEFKFMIDGVVLDEISHLGDGEYEFVDKCR